jgi:hypothetical protein
VRVLHRILRDWCENKFGINHLFNVITLLPSEDLARVVCKKLA